MPDYGIGTAIGAGMGLLLEGHNDRRQVNQQRRLQNLQIEGQKQMVDYNYGKELQMWKDTNFQAQMEQLRMAGLNPALMYKQGGQGGITGQPVGNVTGGNAPTGGMEIMNMMAQKAAIELTKAQTEKTKAETTNVPLTGENIQASTGKMNTEIANIAQDTRNKAIQHELMEIETEFNNIRNTVAGQTQNAQIAAYNTMLRRATAEMHMAERNNEIDNRTMQDNIKKIRAEATGAVLENVLTQEKTNLTKEQILQVVNDVKLAISTDKRNWDQLSLNSRELIMKSGIDDKGIEDIVTGIVMGMITRGAAAPAAGKPISGFHKR